MKIKKSQLKQIIKEELETTMDEGFLDKLMGRPAPLKLTYDKRQSLQNVTHRRDGDRLTAHVEFLPAPDSENTETKHFSVNIKYVNLLVKPGQFGYAGGPMDGQGVEQKMIKRIQRELEQKFGKKTKFVLTNGTNFRFQGGLEMNLTDVRGVAGKIYDDMINRILDEDPPHVKKYQPSDKQKSKE